MRIATWNIERLKHISRQKEIEQICSDVGADILVLTEADNRVRIGSLSYYESEALPERCEVAPGKISEYKSTERRVVIYSRHKLVNWEIWLYVEIIIAVFQTVIILQSMEETLQNAFDECGMTIVTADCKECIDHIAVVNELISNVKNIDFYEWNQTKHLSDHKGVMVTI